MLLLIGRSAPIESAAESGAKLAFSDGTDIA
jgi:hypothetical protein